mmetsp:Transcript_25519/g.52815  ORF Transcript_25519/g.52815 Transcript_25519/m.52815 type:complete len:96 (+) Transcript_25519:1-288(+)
MLVATLEGELDDVKRVETSMRELAELMNLFTMKVSQQTEDVQMIAETTAVAAESVDKGYEELVKAHKRKRTTRTTFITFTLVMSFVLLLCDQLFP